MLTCSSNGPGSKRSRPPASADIGVVLGLYRNNGKEHGNYFFLYYHMAYIWVTVGTMRYIGILARLAVLLVKLAW